MTPIKTLTSEKEQQQLTKTAFVRPYVEEDLDDLIAVYQSAFAEPPWNESWSAVEVEKDLRYALAQPRPIVLVADRSDALTGFVWGYTLPEEKFPFLRGLIPASCIYMDEIAVRGDCRKQGIGSLLGSAFVDAVEANGVNATVLRTDERNSASMALFRALGFSPIRDGNTIVKDPEYPDRVYLQKPSGVYLLRSSPFAGAPQGRVR